MDPVTIALIASGLTEAAKLGLKLSELLSQVDGMTNEQALAELQRASAAYNIKRAEIDMAIAEARLRAAGKK